MGLVRLSVILLLFAIALVLATDDEAVANAAQTYLLIVPLGMGLMGVCANANKVSALERPLPPLLMSAAQMLCLTIPLAILGNNLFGFAGIFIGGLVSQLAIALTAFVWLQRSIQGEANVPSYANSVSANALKVAYQRKLPCLFPSTPFAKVNGIAFNG